MKWNFRIGFRTYVNCINWLKRLLLVSVLRVMPMRRKPYLKKRRMKNQRFQTMINVLTKFNVSLTLVLNNCVRYPSHFWNKFLTPNLFIKHSNFRLKELHSAHLEFRNEKPLSTTFMFFSFFFHLRQIKICRHFVDNVAKIVDKTVYLETPVLRFPSG